MSTLLISFVERIPGIDIDIHHNRFQNKQSGIGHHKKDWEGLNEISDEILIGYKHYKKKQSAGKSSKAVANPDYFGDFM